VPAALPSLATYDAVVHGLDRCALSVQSHTCRGKLRKRWGLGKNWNTHWTCALLDGGRDMLAYYLQQRAVLPAPPPRDDDDDGHAEADVGDDDMGVLVARQSVVQQLISSCAAVATASDVSALVFHHRFSRLGVWRRERGLLGDVLVVTGDVMLPDPCPITPVCVLMEVVSTAVPSGSLGVRRLSDGDVTVVPAVDVLGWELFRNLHVSFPPSHWQVVVVVDVDADDWNV
jgi:hypothetical protein